MVVIGSGPGGSSCAALLANRGYDVTLLEQNKFIGGKCSTYEENGFKVDTGIHMFARGPSGPHGIVARELGVAQPWFMRDPSETMWQNDKGFFYLHQKTTSPRSILDTAKANLTGRMKVDILNTLRRSLKSFGIAGLIREMNGVRKAHPSFVQKYDDVTVRDFLHQFTDDEVVLAALNCLSMLLLVVPFEQASAGEFIDSVAGIFRHGAHWACQRAGRSASPARSWGHSAATGGSWSSVWLPSG